VRHLLLPEERVQLERTARPVRFLAMRFAAKEAIVKGMGTGFAHGVWIRDIGIVQNSWGKPEVVYSARGAKVRDGLGIGEGHVTLTDEAGLVVAVAAMAFASVSFAAPHHPKGEFEQFGDCPLVGAAPVLRRHEPLQPPRVTASAAHAPHSAAPWRRRH